MSSRLRRDIDTIKAARKIMLDIYMVNAAIIPTGDTYLVQSTVDVLKLLLWVECGIRTGRRQSMRDGNVQLWET